MVVGMHRVLALLAALCLAAVSPPAEAQTDKLVAAFEKDVKESGLPYEPLGIKDVVGFKVWQSAQDKQAGKFPIGVFLADETVVISAVVARKASIKVTPDLIASLLEANFNIDFVKIGFTPEGDLTVRCDIRLLAVDGDEVKFLVGVVAKAAETVHAGVAGSLRK